MFSQSIRDYSHKTKNLLPSLLLKKETSLVFFKFSSIEALVTSKIEPFEWSALATCKAFEKITRIELHIITGFSLDFVEDVLNSLVNSGHLVPVKYNRKHHLANLKQIDMQVEAGWKTKQITRILSRQLIKQYQLTEQGKESLKIGRKAVEGTVDLNLILSIDPFKLFFHEAFLKQIALEEITFPPEIISKLLHLAINEGKSLDDQIVPRGLGGDSVIRSFEIVRAQLWFPLQLCSDDKKLSKFNLFITSEAFTKWSNPKVSENLQDILPINTNIRKAFVDALSENYDIIEELVDSSLFLSKNKTTWKFVCDLELLYLIRCVTRNPIENHVSELSVKTQFEIDIVFFLTLIPEDELAKLSLFAARLHAQIKRTGFTYSQGFTTWKSIHQESEMESKKKEYDLGLKILEDSKAVKKSTPKITGLVVDLDGLLAKNQLQKKKWKFKRIKQLEQLLKAIKITQVYYYGTPLLPNKIDALDDFNSWKQDVSFTLNDTVTGYPTDAMRFASDQSFFYMGLPVPKIEGDEELKKLRIEGRVLNYSFLKTLQVPGLQSIYHWYPEDVIKYQYHKNYE